MELMECRDLMEVMECQDLQALMAVMDRQALLDHRYKYNYNIKKLVEHGFDPLTSGLWTSKLPMHHSAINCTVLYY